MQTIWHHMTFTSFESLFLKYWNGSGIRFNVRTFLLRSYLIDVWIRITALQIQTIINQLTLVIWPIINWNKQSCRQEAFFAILLICNISKVTWDFQKNLINMSENERIKSVYCIFSRTNWIQLNFHHTISIRMNPD